MGDTGSMALGGVLSAIAIVSKTEFLLPIAGIIYVVESLSVIIQVVYSERLVERGSFEWHLFTTILNSVV